jgi:hypothetical protein
LGFEQLIEVHGRFRLVQDSPPRISDTGQSKSVEEARPIGQATYPPQGRELHAK